MMNRHKESVAYPHFFYIKAPAFSSLLKFVFTGKLLRW